MLRNPLFQVLGFLGLLVGLLLYVLVRTATPVIDPGHPAVTRLWHQDKVGCTAFIPQVQADIPSRVYIVTAGHCIVADTAKRAATDTASYRIRWVGVINGPPNERRWDVALGLMPAPFNLPLDKRLFLAAKFPEPGTLVWILGFPWGVERAVAARVIDPTPDVWGSGMLRLERPADIAPGSSGTPVVDEQGFVVGIVWGKDAETGTVVVTPVEALHALIAIVKPDRAKE